MGFQWVRGRKKLFPRAIADFPNFCGPIPDRYGALAPVKVAGLREQRKKFRSIVFIFPQDEKCIGGMAIGRGWLGVASAEKAG